MNRKITMGLVAAIAAQFFILLGMYVKAQIPLWTGQPILVKTVPVDPRSLFRGNYAQLSYPFSLLDKSLFNNRHALRQGEVVYVGLQKKDSGLYDFASVSLEKPHSGVFLKGRIASLGVWGATDKYRVDYGIEAYFAPKEKALALEEQLRIGAVAELMVTKNGQVSLRVVRGAKGNQ
ncbi:GDYXXLXY domain-containing protein [Microbulbifer sp. OS29]|uniref:GDYXXLXY domain-containing protein n=1 Tax=Microbulbifer okhotskensis TaxID=2926617 RepID=A0A9X2J5H4_9GAMM|nr:GDYXXLXY domain-containing protein [Microbulbifer okhotskensis]MCO1334409.1 GDYXXLXY domain-containing protein [Microbulbifer okhotskensis]